MRHRDNTLAVTGILLITLHFVAACASAPSTGVRADFERQQVQSVAIVPFYSSNTFGLDDEQYRQLRRAYEQAASEALAAQGFDVVDSQRLREQMAQLGHWEAFDNKIPLRQSLLAYFEPSPAGERDSIEVRTIRELTAEGAFPADTLLFGEIIYHTRGTCWSEATDYIPYARLEITTQAPSNFPRSCVSSHFQAKLVDTTTGHTMWFNRMFVETHTGRVHDSTVDNTIASTVISAIDDGEEGPAALAPGDSDATRADTD